jgi:hypothetical protein
MNQKTLDILDSMESKEEDLKVIRGIAETGGSGQSNRLTVSGTYVMQADTGYYYADKKLVLVPDLSTSSAGSIMLTLRLKVVVPTLTVKVGATILTNIVIIAKPNATQTDKENVWNLAVPRLSALLGTKDIKLTDKKWILENLLATFDVSQKRPKLLQDHKMKQKVIVVIEDSLNPMTNKPSLKIKSISPATDKDISVSNTSPTNVAPQIAEQPAVAGSNIQKEPEIPSDIESLANDIVNPGDVSDIQTASDAFPQ